LTLENVSQGLPEFFSPDLRLIFEFHRKKFEKKIDQLKKTMREYGDDPSLMGMDRAYKIAQECIMIQRSIVKNPAYDFLIKKKSQASSDLIFNDVTLFCLQEIIKIELVKWSPLTGEENYSSGSQTSINKKIIFH